MEDTKAVESQEQARFIKSVLESLEVPIDFDPDKEQSIEDKQKFRQQMREFNLNIINDNDGGLKFYLNSDLIAEWYKSTYKLKQDLSQIDPKDRLYLEMTNIFWSILEDEDLDESESEMQ